MKGTFLTSLPNEILQKILLLLPPIEIVKCRSVCTQIRDNIDGCAEAQRLIELGHEGYQPSRYFNKPWTQSVHNQFREFGRGLLAFTPTSTVIHMLNNGGIAYDDGLRGNDSTTTFGMIPVSYPGWAELTDLAPNPPHGIKILSKRHNYEHSTGTYTGYGISAREGLMVIAYLHRTEKVRGTLMQGFTMEIQLRELSPTSGIDLKPHPRATPDALMVRLLPMHFAQHYKSTIRICGDHVVIQVSTQHSTTVLVVVNWITGAEIMVRQDVYDAKFLAPSQLLIVFHSRPTKKAYLSMIYIRESPDEYLYELPIWADYLALMRLVVSPAARYYEAEKGPFMRELPPWEVDGSLDICALEFEGAWDNRLYNYKFRFVVVIRVNSLQHLGNAGHPKRETPWDEWGPTSTRWFQKQISQIGISIHGSQLLWKVPGSWLSHSGSGIMEVDVAERTASAPLHTAIIDFNPRGVHPLGIQKRLFNPRLVVRDTWTHDHEFLTGTVDGNLPFTLFAEDNIDTSVTVAHEGHYIIDILRERGLGAIRVQSFL